jgi:hypothetical protein
MLGTYLILILFFFFLLRGKTKAIVVLIVISLMNDMFVISFGFSLAVHYFIALVYIPKLVFQYKLIPKKSKGLLAPLYVEFFYLVLLAIIFGYIEPWVSRWDYQRSWSQLAGGRAVIQVFRLISEFSLILIIVLWLQMKQVTIDFIIKVVAIIISCMVVFTLVDFSLGGALKEFLFPEGRLLSDRFTGLNTEPRSFGRICSFVFLLLFIFNKKNDKIIIVGLIFSIVGLIISLSASSYLMTFVWLFIYIVMTKRVKYLLWAVPIIVISLFYLNKNETYSDSTLKKIKYVISIDKDTDKEKVNADEPEIFSSFEIFDRAALNFLYAEPIYFILGTGPNMISIPSSPYLTASTYAIYENTIDSVPHSFLINLISRSGFLGLIIWILFFFKFKHALKKNSNELDVLFICSIICCFIVFSSFFFLILAIVLYSVSKKSKNVKNQLQ